MAHNNKHKREFHLVIWIGEQPGIKETFLATDIEEAEKIVIEKYGDGHVFSLTDPIEECKPRG